MFKGRGKVCLKGRNSPIILGSESEEELSPLGSRRATLVNSLKLPKKDLSLPSLSHMGGHSKAPIVGVLRPSDM